RSWRRRSRPPDRTRAPAPAHRPAACARRSQRWQVDRRGGGSPAETFRIMVPQSTIGNRQSVIRQSAICNRQCIIRLVHIHASAPTRIDLAGGTLDIWPLYLFHDGAQTLNAAISLRASCDLRSRPDRRLVIVSEDAEQRVEVDHWSQLRDNHDLRLLGRLLHYFQAEGLELQTRSDSPVGAGIAGSSALNIAVCGALHAWSGGHRTADGLF